MDMINVLCLDGGRLNYNYIKERYNISNREFRRDIDFIRDRLCDIGYMDKLSTVEFVRSGGRNYYVFNGDKPRLNEAFVNSTIAEALARAGDNTLRDQFEAQEGERKSPPPVRYMYTALERVNYSVFTTLVSAIKDRLTTRVRYINSKGKENVLDINPMVLINYSQIWYLRAETEYGSIRTFSLSRIKDIKQTDKHFEYDEKKLEENEGSYGIFSDKAERVWYTIRFKGVAANIVSNQVWHTEQQGWWDDDSYLLSVPAVSDVEIMGKLLTFLPDSSPVSPPSFVERYKEIIKKCALNLGEEKV